MSNRMLVTLTSPQQLFRLGYFFQALSKATTNLQLYVRLHDGGESQIHFPLTPTALPTPSLVRQGAEALGSHKALA